LDTTATVTVPLSLLLPAAPELLVEPPPLEQAAAIVASATAHPAAASFLREKEDLDELINEPPRDEDVLARSAADRAPGMLI
jgi:hypothetical protein